MIAALEETTVENLSTMLKMETKKSDLLRVFVHGGILSPSDLLGIMEISEMCGNKFIMFGSRQDILFPIRPGFDKEVIASAFEKLKIDYEISDENAYQNIVCSYVAVNIMDTTHWVKEDTFHNVIDSFEYRPKLKINIVDPAQSLVPLFTGELNFIASKQEHYWYLYIRNADKGDSVECWPKLIYSQDIPKVSQAIEEALTANPKLTTEELFIKLQNSIRINTRKIEEKLKLPETFFPYYEGLNAMHNNLYWLGLYWRNNEFAIDFMSAACRLCQDTMLGKIIITPWKSFIIKGIKMNDRIRWDKLMGKFGINMRHSSLELNWHLPVLDKEALDLKRFLVRELDLQDISTHGLTFTIKTARKMLLFTSVVIEKNLELSGGSESIYNILYAKDFNANNSEYFTYAQGVKKEIIPALLIELSKIYFRQLNPEKDLETTKSKKKSLNLETLSYQCTNCLTIYDKKFGDPSANIAPGTPFEKLPDHYRCHVCESGKEYFRPVIEY